MLRTAGGRPIEARDERSLIALARDGSRPAFAAIHARWRDEVFGFLAGMLGDASLAEDVLQETFLRVHASLARYDDARPFRAWLYQIARNAAVDAARVQRKVEKLEAAVARDERVDHDALAQAARAEDAATVRDALATLDVETRALVLQRLWLDMTLDELADSWSCTERTIRNRLRAAADELAARVVELRSKGGRP